MRGGGGGRRRPKRDDDKRRGDGEEDEDRRQRTERLKVLQQRLDDKADHIGTLPTRQWRQQVTDYLTDAGQIFDLKEELTQEDDVRKGWTVHIIDVRRVIKVTKRGGVMRVSALVVAGDGNGTASYGKARAEEMSDAVPPPFLDFMKLDKPPHADVQVRCASFICFPLTTTPYSTDSLIARKGCTLHK